MMQLAERNYEIYNKELLAIVEALTKWRQYCYDLKLELRLYLDKDLREVKGIV